MQDSLDPDPPRMETTAFSAPSSPPRRLGVGAAALDEPRRRPWPPRRRVVAPLLLFLATSLSVFIAGALSWDPLLIFVDPARASEKLVDHGWDGFQYMAAFIGILLAHEMGHFLQAVRYGVPASYPYFIPAPFIPTGSMGAVINLWGSWADRKQLFDIGGTGPWAGLAVALPVVAAGIASAPLDAPRSDALHLGDPLLFKLLTLWLRPELAYGVALEKTPLLMAGWIGILITGLNMLPVSQFDGGHVIYGLFGHRAHWIARGTVVSAIAAMVIADDYQWVLMLVIALLLGVDHPPTRDDNVPLGWPRRLVGYASLTLPIFCFTPRIL